MKASAKAAFRTLIVSILAASSPASFYAPSAHAAETDAPPLETIVVTGSFIHRTDTETPSPVTVLSKDQIEKSGLTTIYDAIHTISADNSGTIPTAFAGGFAPGSAGVALRGLTVNSTLVLVDGRRLANYPFADDGQRSFVDLNSIPLTMVDRIEVLKDGASSLYGADAIAGVVNIIMKREYSGAEVSADVGTSQHGGGSTVRVSGNLGSGSLKDDGHNAYLTFEYQKDGKILTSDRGFPFNTSDLSSIGGNNLLGGQPSLSSGSVFGSVTPGTVASNADGTPNLLSGTPLPGALVQPLRPCGAHSALVTDATGSYCEQNLQSGVSIQPAAERLGVTGRFTVKLSDVSEAYLSSTYYQNHVVAVFPPNQIQNTSPVNTNSIALPPLLANGSINPNNPFASQGQYALINYAFGDIPFGIDVTSHSLRSVMGYKTRVAGWDLDAAIDANHSWNDFAQPGYISLNGLLSAINDGSYSFVNPSSNSAATRALVAPTPTKTSTSDLYSVDLRGSHDLFALPGGTAAVALGAELRHEAQNDPNINPRLDYLGTGRQEAAGSRQVAATFLEIALPIVSTFEANLSGRYDHYSDFGGKATPKIGLKWTPIRQLALRSTYSEGFRAPSFSENGSSEAEGCISYTPPADFQALHGNNGYVQQYNLCSLTVANKAIKPETAKNFTFGAIIEPTKWLSASLDYYAIKKNNVIAQSNPVTALNAYYAGGQLPAGFSVTPDRVDPAYPSILPRPAVVASPYQNANALQTDGIDLNLRVTLNLGSAGRFYSDIDVTKIFSFKLILPDGSEQQYAGTQGPYYLSSGAGTPRYRGSWTNGWEHGPVSVTATTYYTSGFTQTGPDFLPADQCLYADSAGNSFPRNCRIASFWYVDLTGEYRINDRLKTSLVVSNVFDRQPPIDPSDYAGINFNPTYHYAGIVGRYLKFGLLYKFQ